MRVESYLAEGTRLELTHALLLYTAATRQMATIHKVAGVEEGPLTILPGECLTREAIEEILTTIQKAPTGRQILPPEVLCASGVLCWWKPALRAPIFFNTSKKAFNETMSGSEVLHPPLVFLAKPGRLQIFALQQNERPTAQTTLCRAPYYNLYGGSFSDEGAMCRGNVRLPEVCLSRDIPIWEGAFYETNFTHSNLHGREITRHKGGHDGLWCEAKGWAEQLNTLPDIHNWYLIPLKQTLEEVVNK